ncbi:MAG: SpoIIE family protein phosphatase, partial [Spirochaetes bacterium]|nr:SpoIIE family protein phosphatase [Spirochaetota bacterium]
MISKTIKTIFLSVLWITSIVISYANIPLSQYMITNWTTSNGLPSNSVLDILQGRKGYIWLATYDGLVKFDGIDFTVLNRLTRQDFNTNSIRVLAEDHTGALWLGTNDAGLQKFVNGQITLLFTIQNGLPDNSVRTLLIDSQNSIWIGTNKGLAKLNPNNHLSTFQKPELMNNLIQFIYEDKQQNIWVGTNNGKILKKSPDVESDFIAIDFPLINQEIINVMLEDQNNDLWFGTINGKLFVQKENETIQLPANHSDINSIYEDKEGTVLIATDNGLIRYVDGKIETLSENNILKSNLIETIIEDREGNIWFGTGRGGLIKLSTGKFIKYGIEDGLSNNVVNTILQDRKGNFWIGTDLGLNYFKNNQFSDHKLVNLLKKDRIRHLFQDHNDTIWVATYGNTGLVSYDIKGQVKTYTKQSGLTGNKIRVIIEDHRHNIWVGTKTGLNKIENDKITTFTRANGLSDDYILSLFKDSKDQIWIGTDGGGVNILKDNKFTILTKKDGLAGNIIFRFYEDNNETIWISTNGGLSRYKNGNMNSIDISDGLQTDSIFEVIEDSNESFWLSSNIGIIYTKRTDLNQYIDGNTDSLQLKVYSKDDGLTGGVTAVAWSEIDQNGHIWFPTLEGIAKIDPLNITQNKYKPQAILETLVIDDQLFLPENGIKILPGKKRIVFDYTGLSYLVPEKVKFSFMLEGFEDSWSPPTDKREVTYTNLSPGKYTFKVKAANNDSLWGAETVFKFYQKAFFYQTIWFYLVVFLFLILAGIILYQVRIRHLKMKQIVLDQLVKERTRQLTIANEEIAKKNEDILDSIRCAKNIQRSLLPKQTYIDTILPNNFIYWKPKDIIGGDIYFTDKRDDNFIIALMDCTGHGVPGAIMTILAFTMLKRVIRDLEIHQPGEILKQMNLLIKDILKQDKKETLSDDGLDAAICLINSRKKQLIFSGARIPLYYYQNQEAHKVKGNKQSLGY